MDAQQFARAVGEAITKFGRAPEDMIKALLANRPVGDSLDPNSNQDAVLADFLEDHEDPREAIVRRDLEYRKEKYGFYAGGAKHLKSLVGETPAHKKLAEEDDHTVSKYYTPDGRTAYTIWWEPSNTKVANYKAHFSPEEAEPILQYFGVEER